MTNASRETDKNQEAGLSAFVLYEDKITGLRAKLFLDQLETQIHVQNNGSPALWRLDSVCRTKLRRHMAKLAAEADLLLISLHGDQDLSAELIDWLHLWSRQRKTRVQILGVLLDKKNRKTLMADDILFVFNSFSHAQNLTTLCCFPDESDGVASCESEAWSSALQRLKQRQTPSHKANHQGQT